MSSRRYTSDRRAAAALETRGRIIAAAERELASVGYHAMTVAGLARAAQVSPQTIYNSIGSKAAVVKALYDVRLAGDDGDLPIRERPDFLAMLAQPDPESVLAGYAQLGRTLYSRVAPLLGVLLGEGPGSDAELLDFITTIEGERRTGNERLLAFLADRFGDRVRSDQAAADVLWMLTSFDVSDRLVRRCGWSLDAYQAWLTDQLVANLIARS